VDIELTEGDRRPIFLQIAGAIRAAIARGAIAPGDSLPPIRTLAAQIGVHANTVLQAYRELATLGAIHSRRGSGSVVTSQPIADGERRVLADGVAQRALQDADAHGLTVSDLDAALERLRVRSRA